MNHCREYLEQMVASWEVMGAPALLERFVLRNGKEYQGRKKPKKYPVGSPKECFSNAAKLVWLTKLQYVEGYVLRAGLPLAIHHAWAIDAKGRVIDNTLQDPENCTYMGVPLTSWSLWDELRKTKVFGLLDTGYGLNTKFMFAKDPELEGIVRAVRDAGPLFKRKETA